MSDLAVRNPVQDLVAQVRSDQFKEQAAMVLPENVPVSRFVRSFCTLAMANPDVATWERDSVFVSLFKAASDGLLPDGREAAIVAYKGKAQYIRMIGGVVKLAAEHGWSITTRVVYANDVFDYELGLSERISHKPATGDRGDRVYAYAVGRHRDGRAPMVEVMDAADIAKVRKVSRAAERGPWVDWPDRMWEKSVGHRLFKRLPLDPADKRVARMIVDAEDLGPDESAKMLYGPGGAAYKQIGEGTEVSGRVGTEPDTAVEASAASAVSSFPDDQQAAEGETAEAGASPSAVPGMPAAPAPSSGFAVPDAVLDEAGAVVVQTDNPDSGWNGWTVARMAADPGPGHRMLAYCCGPDGDERLDPATVAAIRLYVQHRLPDVWAKVTA